MKEPSVKETAFSCPHCGAYATQHWYNCFVIYINKDPRIPFIPDEMREKIIREDKNIEGDAKERLLKRVRKLRSKLLFTNETYINRSVLDLSNLFLSKCFNCGKLAVWVNEDLVYPSKKFGALPNQDLPQDILDIVDEARAIINASPKGAAALLRLSVQKLCKHLGEQGEKLNEDIKSLVSKGLNPMVAKSLDIVRVIGNEAVHPGVIDLNDDKDTAIKLFDLVNIIAEQMITHPKHVEEVYGKLPEAKRKAIEERDKKT